MFIAERMTADRQPANLDLKPLAGRAPWLRIRVGDVRILCRPLKATEGPAGGGAGYLIARIVRQRDLERTISQL